MRILLVEDDAGTAAYIIKGLKESGHVIDHAADGRDGWHLARENDYDVLIVDRMLPAQDGLSLIQALRAASDKTPILVLSALAEVGDRVEGLRAGADDYLVKPFAFAELLARLDALLRRAASNAPANAWICSRASSACWNT